MWGNILTHGQISGLTNRNHIRLCMRVRLLNKPKPNNYTESKFTIPCIKKASKMHQSCIKSKNGMKIKVIET